MDPSVEDAIAERLLDAQLRHASIEPIARATPGFDQAAAYRVAERVLARRVARGERPVGRKIGFTNRNIWPEYGVYEPIWGHVYDRTVLHADDGKAVLAMSRFTEPRIEPEVVLHFAVAPPRTTDPLALIECIDWIAHGYEIVDSPFPGWKFGVADTIAAFALHACLVVGAPRPIAALAPDPRTLADRLRTFTIELCCNATVRDRGRGSNVLDGPLEALAHCIGVIATQPGFAPIGAGEIVTTGTLTAAFPVAAGELWTTRLDGIALPGLALRLDP